MSLQDLKDELLLQKTAVESKYGTVTVRGTHPSPSEITAGINSINTPDLSGVTATASDVLSGKVFVNSSGQSVTGQLTMIDNSVIQQVFLYTQNTISSTTRVTYRMPTGLLQIRPYAFYNNYNPVLLYLDSAITTIGNSAFYNARDINFANFADMQSLVTIGNSAFNGYGGTGMDLGSLPQTLTSIGTYGFKNSSLTGVNISVPYNCTLGDCCFGNLNGRINIGSFSINSAYTKTYLPVDCLYFTGVNGDLTVPSSVTNVRQCFNYRGSFRNLTFKSTLTTLGAYSFGGVDGDPVSNYYLQTVTFEGETPPVFGQYVFATHHVTNNFKIYVPDNSVEAYKAVSNLSYCQNCIYPVSQRP